MDFPCMGSRRGAELDQDWTTSDADLENMSARGGCMDIRRFYSHYSKFVFDIKARRERSILNKYLDKQFYMSTYPEVSKSGLDPIEHYRTKGWLEGLNPHPDFDTLIL